MYVKNYTELIKLVESKFKKDGHLFGKFFQMDRSKTSQKCFLFAEYYTPV